MKKQLKNKTLATTMTVAIGAVASLSGAGSANALPAMGFKTLGSGAELRAEILSLNAGEANDLKESEDKCGDEKKCGENTCGGGDDDDKGPEGSCGDKEE